LNLWIELARRTGDEAFGIHIAQRAALPVNDVIEYTLSHSVTLGAAFRQLIRFQRIIHDAACFGLEVDGETAHLSHRAVDSEVKVPPPMSEYFVATMLLRGRTLIRRDWTPLEVHFSHPEPVSTRDHRRLFGCPVLFRQPVTEMLFDAALLQEPVPAADPALGAMLERLARGLLDRLPDESSFADSVRHHIRATVREGPPEAAEIAKRMAMSERSFFRELQRQGTSYLKLVDSVRRELACERLRDPRFTISEVAFLVGFSEGSAFHRAFRRWTGESPSDFRRKLASAA
jgi:AraC-like DNA-binding protein